MVACARVADEKPVGVFVLGLFVAGGLLLSLFTLWIWGRAQPPRPAPAPWAYTESAPPAASELDTGALPIDRVVTF